MINTVILNDEIKVWWEYVRLESEHKFAVFLDGKLFEHTQKSHSNIKNLKSQTEYSIRVELVDGKGEIKQVIGEACVITAKTKRQIDITKPPYNAIPDGRTLNTLAIQKAVDACGEDECVYFPCGTYLTGAIDLKSNVELYLADDAVIQGSTDEKDYLPKVKSRFEGSEVLCYRSLFNAGVLDSKGGANCENVTIRGGKVFGGGQELRTNIINAERPGVLKANGLENELNPPFFYSTVLPGRPRGRLLGFNNVKNVIVANSELGNSPSWNLHFVYCENVNVCSSKVCSHRISNGDGIDPDSTVGCFIFDIIFDTGDDCVAIKSGKNFEGYSVGRPCKNVRVFDVFAIDGHGIAVGSEMSGGIEDVAIWNCDISAGTGIHYKTSPVRGGYVKNVKLYNTFVPTVSVKCNYFSNNDGKPAPSEPQISDLYFEDITVTGVGRFTGEHERVEPETAFVVSGLSKENPVRRLKVKNLTLKYRQMLPNQVIKFNNVEDLTAENIICLGEID